MRKTKIVCTLGPSTAGVERIGQLIEAGMDVARLNMSFGDHESMRHTYRELREAAQRAQRPVAVLMDLSGPKIRVGRMQGGAIRLTAGRPVVLTSRDGLGSAERIPHSYSPLAHDVRPGDRILLDDGLLSLQVEAVEGDDVHCKVIDGGVLRDNKGMNLPGTALSTPALTDKDRRDIALGCELGTDYFALSFVRAADDLREAHALAGSIPVIAKIEKPEAVLRLQEILAVADGVMVARGDLGVEAGAEKVPLIQKRILREARPRAIPTITATQMLDSMVQNPRPTRAEVSDVANAVLDGTDAVMLSAETSMGAYPVESVQTLASIIREIETSSGYDPGALPGGSSPHERTFANAIAQAVDLIGDRLGLSAIAVYTESGRSAALMSAARPRARIVAFSLHDRVLNRLALHWGVRPVPGGRPQGVAPVIEHAERELLARGLVRPGENMAIALGTVIGEEPIQTNTLKLWRVRR